MSYSSYDHDDLEPASTMRIERRIYFESGKADLSEMVKLPLAELLSLRAESAAAEQEVFDRLKEQAAAWEEQAGRTLFLDKALEYARTLPVTHTANQWEAPDEYRHIRSNMVYQMDYSISENTRYDSAAQKSIPYSWTLRWGLYTNVKECRPLLNQGQYHLPEPPQLADFDQSLQDYKKQIEAELEQEAAASGLTVEEYVASDYEAPAQPNFSIYQVPPGPEGRDFRYRSYEDLQADGLSVDRKNYQLVYTAPLDKDTTLDEIYRRFNMEHPADYKGHSLSMGDIVVFRQDGKQTAYYVDEGADYRQVPEFFAQPEKQLTPDECMTGEQIQTPRGRFYLTDRSREQMEAAGYGFHHQSDDGRYLIMANGTRAFAIPAQQESHIKTAEMSTEQNYNMIDGMMNNAPSMEELEARAKAGEQISLLDVAEAAKAEAQKPKQTRRTTQKQKKPSIRAQLAAAKEEQKKRPPAREKSKEMEV